MPFGETWAHTCLIVLLFLHSRFNPQRPVDNFLIAEFDVVREDPSD